MKPKKKNVPRRRTGRKRVGMPVAPPPVSINPWRRVTLSLEDEGNNKDKCVSVANLIASLKDQLKINIARVEIRLLRVRAWNRGRMPHYDAANKVEVPAVAGPLCINICDLVSNMASTSCEVTYLRTVEAYPGRASWARVSHTWRSPSNRLIIGSGNDKAVVFTWRAPENETVVFHIVLSYRAAASGSFSESTLRVASSAHALESMPSSPFDKMVLTQYDTVG